jgi:hypothetical protein
MFDSISPTTSCLLTNLLRGLVTTKSSDQRRPRVFMSLCYWHSQSFLMRCSPMSTLRPLSSVRRPRWSQITVMAGENRAASSALCVRTLSH